MPASVFDAAPLELERAMDALSVAASSSTTTPLPPLPPALSSSSQPQPHPQQDAASSIPSRLLSSLPSYLLPAFLVGGGGRGTFKPLKQHTSNKRISLHRYSQATLATGITRAAVACPPSEDPDEWLAVHTVDAYNEVSLLFGVISDQCLPASATCQVMNAGAEYQYLWADNKAYRTPTKVSAREYVGLLLSWVEEQLNDEGTFPGSTDVPFPRHFKPTVAKIFTRLFRVYAHLYLTHLPHIEARGALQHLNSCFKHFLFCALEFSLIDDRELAPLQPLIRGILAEDARRTALDSPDRGHKGRIPKRPQRPAPSPSAQARLSRSQSGGGGGSGGMGGLRPTRAFSSPSQSSPSSPVVSLGAVPSSEEAGASTRRAQSQQLTKGSGGEGGGGGRPGRSCSSDLERRGAAERLGLRPGKR